MSDQIDVDNVSNMCEWDKYVNILNIFQLYYKNLYKTDPSESLFSGIDYDSMSSTNRALELLYQYTLEFKQNKIKGDKYTDVCQNIDIEDYDDVYMLVTNCNTKLYSSSLLSLVTYLSENDEWKKGTWVLTKIKGEL